MVALSLKGSNQSLGEISDEELQFLVDNLEEESLTDEDYTIDRLTLEYLRGNGMSPRLAQILENARGDRGEVEIRYERK